MAPPLTCPLCAEELFSALPDATGLVEHLSSAHFGAGMDSWQCGGPDPWLRVKCSFRCAEVKELVVHCLRVGHSVEGSRQTRSSPQEFLMLVAQAQRELVAKTGSLAFRPPPKPVSAAVATQTSEELVAAASGQGSLSIKLSPSHELPETYALLPTAYYPPHRDREGEHRFVEAAEGVSDGSGQSCIEESAEDEVIRGGGKPQETSSQPTQPQPFATPSAGSAPSAASAKPRDPSRKIPKAEAAAEAAADALFGQPASKRPRGRPQKPKEPSIPGLLAPVKQEVGTLEESFQSGSGRRFSLGEKVAAVERVLGGEPKKAVARSLAVCPKVVRDWLSSEHKLRAALNQAA